MKSSYSGRVVRKPTDKTTTIGQASIAIRTMKVVTNFS